MFNFRALYNREIKYSRIGKSKEEALSSPVFPLKLNLLRLLYLCFLDSDDTFAQVVETSVNVTTNSLSQDYTPPDDHMSPTYTITKCHLN